MGILDSFRNYFPLPGHAVSSLICIAGCVISLGRMSQRLLLVVPVAEFYIDKTFFK